MTNSFTKIIRLTRFGVNRKALLIRSYFIFFFTVLANIPCLYAGHAFGFAKDGFFALDYLVLGICFLFLPRFLSVIALLLLQVIDLALSVRRSYFLPLSACLPGRGFWAGLSNERILSATIVALLIITLMVLAVFLPSTISAKSYRRGCVVSLLTLLMVMIGVDGRRNVYVLYRNMITADVHIKYFAQIEQNIDILRDTHYTRILVLRCIANMLNDHRLMRIKAQSHSMSVPQANYVLSKIYRLISNSNPAFRPNVVIILAESWGRTSNYNASKSLFDNYLNSTLQVRYDVEQGTVPFSGGTIAGEGRTLCASTIGFHLLDAMPTEMQNCFPYQLDVSGYHSIAVHGMSRFMFQRNVWWNRIGFQETWFHGRLAQLGLPDCDGAFIGTCDSSIANWIAQRLSTVSPSPVFLYWVTLNTHLPVPVPAPINATNQCPFSSLFGVNSPICSWFQLEDNLHRSIAKLAMSEQARPTIFLVVGDHAPPFANAEMRNQFSSTEVPYLLLVPKCVAVEDRKR